MGRMATLQGTSLHHRQNTPVSSPDPWIARPIPAHTAEIRRSRPGRRRSGNPRNTGRSPAPLAGRMIASNANPSNPRMRPGREKECRRKSSESRHFRRLSGYLWGSPRVNAGRGNKKDGRSGSCGCTKARASQPDLREYSL